MPYALLASPHAQRDLDDLPVRIADGIRLLLHALAEEPRSRRFDIKQLGGSHRSKRLRLRIGEYRILLDIDHQRQQILVARIGHRSTVYRGWDGGD